MEGVQLFEALWALLPGFCFVYLRRGFLPTRRVGGDTHDFLEALTLTAILWAALELVLAAVHLCILTVGALTHRTLEGPAGFIPSVLEGTAPRWQVVTVIASMNIAALLLGFVSVRWQRPDNGTMRTITIAGQDWDPNPRVWSWWLGHEQYRSFRITLTSGRVLIGQVIAYSEDPNDDLQELVLKGVSEVRAGNAFQLSEVDEMLIAREAITTMEMLDVRLAAQDSSTTDAAPRRRRWLLWRHPKALTRDSASRR